MSKASSAIVPPLSVDRGSSDPLHRQLYLHLRELILTGQLRAGVRLPSTRDLAQELELSRNTVLTAFDQLLADGFLEGRTGAGTFVAQQAQRPHGSARGSTHEQGSRTGLHPDSESRNLQRLYRTRERYVPRVFGAFRTNAPALDVFPWVTWSQAVHRAMRTARRDDLFYSDPMGVRSFREAVAEYLRTARNVRCEADQIFVVSGSQQALSLTATVLLDPGDKVGVEEPGYSGAWKAFLLNDNVICPVPVGADGLDSDSLRQLCPDVRLVYVTPSHQFPLGVTMSLQRRLELLEWANEANAWIVEDDYDSEYRYSTTPLSSLQGLSDQDRVIYTGTFSKVLFPALRIGYVVVPPDLVDQFALVRESFDLYPSPLLQLALQIFIEQGTFAKHSAGDAIGLFGTSCRTCEIHPRSLWRSRRDRRG